VSGPVVPARRVAAGATEAGCQPQLAGGFGCGWLKRHLGRIVHLPLPPWLRIGSRALCSTWHPIFRINEALPVAPTACPVVVTAGRESPVQLRVQPGTPTDRAEAAGRQLPRGHGGSLSSHALFDKTGSAILSPQQPDYTWGDWELTTRKVGRCHGLLREIGLARSLRVAALQLDVAAHSPLR
jgi:hypothetical protein